MGAAIARDAELGCVLLRRHINLATSHIMGAMFPAVSVPAIKPA